MSDDWKQSSTETLLYGLSVERGRFSAADESAMRQLVAELIRRGEYPTEWNGKPIDVWGRVQGYGAHWHRYQEPLSCARCSADFRDAVNGPPFKREIGESSRKYDRVLAYHCPDCGFTWPR